MKSSVELKQAPLESSELADAQFPRVGVNAQNLVGYGAQLLEVFGLRDRRPHSPELAPGLALPQYAEDTSFAFVQAVRYLDKTTHPVRKRLGSEAIQVMDYLKTVTGSDGSKVQYPILAPGEVFPQYREDTSFIAVRAARYAANLFQRKTRGK